jgi:Flp pilus assembly protein TadD
MTKAKGLEHTRATRLLGVGGALALALMATAGCKNRRTAEGPEGPPVSEADVPAGPASNVPVLPPSGAPDAAAVAPEMKGTKPPGSGKRPQDRDPEEEKRKMSLSRERSKAAVTALRSGDLEKAISEARQALRIHEQNVEAMLVIGEAMYKQGKFEIAQSVCASALKVDPVMRTDVETSRVHNILGFAYLAEHKRAAAMTEFRKAADLDPKNASAWNNLGVQYSWQGDHKTAESCFRYATELDGRFVGAVLNLGASLRGLGRLPEAEQAFRRALELQSNLAFAHFNLGVLYLDAESFGDMDVEQRLNKSIVELSRYKELAIAAGADRPDPEKSLTSAVGLSALGNELVSPDQADMYIEAAKKGIEREQRRKERDQQRKDRDEAKAAKAAEQPPAEAPPQEPPKKDEGGGGDAGASKPGGGSQPPPPASPQKPGGEGTSPQKPGSGEKPPGPQKPGGNAASAPDALDLARAIDGEEAAPGHAAISQPRL